MVSAKQLGYEKGQAIVSEGAYSRIMPNLIKAGYTPQGTSQIMDQRIAHPDKDHPIWNNHIDTDTGIAGDSDRVLILSRCRLLREITPYPLLTAGGIALPQSYNGQVTEFDRKELILNKGLTEKQALKHKLWLALADNDNDRLARYVEAAFRLGEDKFGYDKMMGFVVPEDSEPIVRSVYLDMLKTWSGAFGNCDIDHCRARLVGVRGSGEAASNENSSSIITTRESDKNLLAVLKEFNVTCPEELKTIINYYKSS